MTSHDQHRVNVLILRFMQILLRILLVSPRKAVSNEEIFSLIKDIQTQITDSKD